MTTDLFNINEYCLFTFVSTSHALKAEKVLKNEEFEFVMIPTLREISSSCGLAVKTAPDDVENCKRVLGNSNVKTEGLYKVVKEQGKNLINRIDA